MESKEEGNHKEVSMSKKAKQNGNDDEKNYKQRKDMIQNLWEEYVKNKEATCNYWDESKTLYGYYDRNYNNIKNENVDYRNNNTVAGLITELKTNLKHLTKVIPKIICFKYHLMHTLESLESSLKNVCEVENGPDIMRKERSIELVVLIPDSLSNYETRKEAIKILDKEITRMDDAVQAYIDDYQERPFCVFGEQNEKDYYSRNEHLREFIIEMEELEVPITNVLCSLNAYKAHLMKFIEILEKNLKDMEKCKTQE